MPKWHAPGKQPKTNRLSYLYSRRPPGIPWDFNDQDFPFGFLNTKYNSIGSVYLKTFPMPTLLSGKA